MPLSERDVQEQLRSALDKDWLSKLLAAVQRVPSGLAPLALDLLGVDADGRERTPAEMPSFFARAQSIANLSAADRQALFEGLFPGKGAVLEGGWQLLRKLPYRNGYPWRCPVAEAPGLPSRLEWLTSMTGALGALGNRPLSWYAVWHGRTFALDFSGLGVLLAAGMDLPGTDADELAATVQRVLQGGDEIGRPTRELIRACLHTSRPGMNEFVTQHLLTAGREEGLREMILGSVDSSRAEVLPQFARLILDHGLARFSSTIQAFNEWFGIPYDAPTGPLVNPTLQKTLRLLEEPAHRAECLGQEEAQTVYLALWAQAFEDIGQLQLDTLDRLLAHPQPGHRLAAATLAANLDRAVVSKRLVPRLADEDWRVVRVANEAFLNTAAESIQAAGLFDALATLLDRMPAKLPPLKPLLWPWETHEFSPDHVLQALLANRHTRSPALAERHLPKLSAAGRAHFAEALANFDHHDPETQRILTRLLPDPSPEVREIAARALRAQSSLDPTLAPEWEGMLKRKTGEVREHALALLVKLSDAQALESADRLLSARDALTRSGGLELLRQLVAAGRVYEAARQRVEAFQSRVIKISPHDQPHVDAVLSASVPRLSLEDALGLAPAALRTPPLIPRLRPGPFASPTSPALAAALEVEFEKHSATRFRLRSPFDDSEFDADLATAFSHAAVPERTALVATAESRVPLRSTWVDWLRQRGPDLRDPDGFELLRLLARKFARWRGSLTESALPAAERQRLEPFFGPDWAKSDSQKRWATDFMPWLLRWDPPQGDWPGFVLDGYESTLALIHDGPFNHSSTCSEGWLHVARLGRVLWPERWRPAHHARLWRLLRWRDAMAREGRARITLPLPAENSRSKVLAALQQAQTTVASDPCWRGSFDDGVAAFATGGATEADLLDLLLSNRDTLRAISQRPIPRWLPECPALRPVLARATERLLEIELARGDTPTPATRPCLCLRSLEGMSAFTQLLAALGDQPFERQSGAGQDRRSVFSDLLSRSHPAPDETPERFAYFIQDLGLTPERLVEAAVFAPQWARHVETATGWSGLAQGIAWIHAHTKVADSDLSPTDQAAWKAEMAQHSPLSGDDLMDGAVDVTWFQRLYQELGPRRWAVLEEAAKYASTGSGHARARLFAQALRNDLDEADLVQRVRRQRQQDAVRALGLLRLPARGRDRKLFERYQVLQEFLRGSANSGAQRRASEKRAFEIGLANLARTAGFQTPLRLLWAMEARAVDDLADGQLSVTAKVVTVSLSIDVWGDAITTITRAGKPLPKLPAALSKHAGIAALRHRKTELKHQASRIRTTLESMMNQGETVLGADLPGLMRHPLLAPMLRDLVLVGEGIAGYPVQEGRVLQRHDGSQEALKSRELLRLAHPVDLLPAREWSAWQRECFARERIQPFKQVFREWYPLTDTERGEVTQSRRYAGHQLWPRQALAILGAHGWIHRDGGEVCKILHAEGLVARLEFEQSWGTPADLEGLTVSEVCFTRRDARDRLRLEEIPARCFSEVMRELDLAVSVAHCGGVDPEASAASVEGRGALVRETTTLLGLDGVTVHERHVEIRGQLGRYTVHLGSGIAHRVPGGMLSLVAVRSQQRGRLFLPFVDDDPASAEILSKVLLLARDTEIRDPAIQSQLRRP